MKCPKCNLNNIRIAESLKRIIDPNDVEEYEEEILYIQCLVCNYRSFGDDAVKEFGTDKDKPLKFNYSVTDKDVINRIIQIAESEEEDYPGIKEALEKGWHPTLEELWNNVKDMCSDNPEYFCCVSNEIEQLIYLEGIFVDGRANRYLDELEEEQEKGKWVD